LNIVVTVWEMITPNEVFAGSGENTLLIGSSPVVGTIFIEENADSMTFRADSAQDSGASRRNMKFPVIIKHRRSGATIYAKSGKYPYPSLDRI
jgi:hypothetical protein